MNTSDYMNENAARVFDAFYRERLIAGGKAKAVECMANLVENLRHRLPKAERGQIRDAILALFEPEPEPEPEQEEQEEQEEQGEQGTMPPRWAEVYIAAWSAIGGGINARMSDLLTADREEVAARAARKFGGTVAGWRIFVDAALDAIGGES